MYMYVLVIMLMDYRIGAANNHNSITHKQIPRLHTYIRIYMYITAVCMQALCCGLQSCLLEKLSTTYNENACKCDLSKCHIYVYILVDLQQLVTYVRNNNRLSQFVFIAAHQGHALYMLINKYCNYSVIVISVEQCWLSLCMLCINKAFVCCIYVLLSLQLNLL